MRKLAALVALAAAPVLMTTAAASAYPPGAPTLTLSPSTVAPGGAFGATFTGCALGDTVTVSIEGGASASATCSGTGGGTARGIMQEGGPSASVMLNAPTVPGTYTVTATAPGASATATLTVTAAAPAGPSLPTTGSDTSIPITQVAIGVLLAGLGLVGVAWYRRKSVHAT
jgi:LPXTG-motif cell wall-anchored protein